MADPLGPWLKWPADAALQAKFLSEQQAVLAHAGIPTPAPPVPVAKKDAKRKKKDADDKKESKIPKKIPFVFSTYDSLSDFGAYAQVRKAILEVRAIAVARLQTTPTPEAEAEEEAVANALVPLSQCTMLGLRSVMDILGELFTSHPPLAERMLLSTLDILQGMEPGSLMNENAEFLDGFQRLLETLARQESPFCGLLQACLCSLALARGSQSKLTLAATTLLAAATSNPQGLPMPVPKILRRLVTTAQNSAFPAGVPPLTEAVASPATAADTIPFASLAGGLDEAFTQAGQRGAIACDGRHVYVHTGTHLIKIGTGYGGTVRGRVLNLVNAPVHEASVTLLWHKTCLLLRYGDEDPGHFTAIDPNSLGPTGPVRCDTPLGSFPHSIFATDASVGALEAGPNGWAVRRFVLVDGLLTETVAPVTVEHSFSQVGAFGPAVWDNETDFHCVVPPSSTIARKIVSSASMALMLTEAGRLCLRSATTETLGIPTPLEQWTVFPLSEDIKIANIAVFSTQEGFVLQSEEGKIYTLAPTAKGRKPLEVLYSSDSAPVVSFALTPRDSIVALLRTGSVVFLKKTPKAADDGKKKDKDKKEKDDDKPVTTSAHPHPMVPNKSKKGACATCKRKLKGSSRRSEGGYRCTTCDSFLCQTCFGAVPQNLAAEFTVETDVCKASTADFQPSQIVVQGSDKVFLLSANGDAQLAVFGDPASGQKARCADGSHTFKVEKALICRACNECTSKGKSCYRASRKDKVPGEPCGCGAGDAGCTTCGICRACDKPSAAASTKLTLVGPLALPAETSVLQIVSGDAHTLVLAADGSVYGMGDNSEGQLGLEGVANAAELTKVPLPARALHVGAGPKHSVVVLEDGTVRTAGNNADGQLGRKGGAAFETSTTLGTVRWLSVSGKRAYFSVATSTVDETSLADAACVLDGDTLLASTTTPQPSTLVFNLHSRACSSVGTLTALAGQPLCRDPDSRIVWTFSARDRSITAYDPLLAALPKAAPGTPEGLARPEAVLMAPAALLPASERTPTTPAQAAVAILASIDSLNRGRIGPLPPLVTTSTGQRVLTLEDYTVCKRFSSLGGGWGYSGGSNDAVAFTVDTDILLGGVGLYGSGSSEFNVTLDVVLEGMSTSVIGSVTSSYSIDMPGGESAENWYPVMFAEPLALEAGVQYAVIARISSPSGNSSSCGSQGQSTITTDEGVVFNFSSSSHSGNGTDVSSGQVPTLLFHLPLPPAEAVKEIEVRVPKTLFAYGGPESITTLTNLLLWCWQTLQAPLGVQHSVGGPSTIALIASTSLRLIKTCFSAVFLRDAQGNLSPFSAKDVSDLTVEAILALRQYVQNMLAELPHSFGVEGPPTGPSATVALGLVDLLRDAFQVFFPTPNMQVTLLEQLLHRVDSETGEVMLDPAACLLLQAVLEAVAQPSCPCMTFFDEQPKEKDTDGAAATGPVLPALPEELEGEDALVSLEVSTNKDQGKRLLENTDRVWESSGPSGTHWIELNMLPGTVISDLTMVAITQDSYRPARLTIKAGPSSDELSILEVVQCASARVGSKIPLLSDCTEHYPVVRICIEAEGINTRINGILVTAVRSRSGTRAAAPRISPYGELVAVRERMVANSVPSTSHSFPLLVRKLLCIVSSLDPRHAALGQAVSKLLSSLFAQTPAAPATPVTSTPPDRRLVITQSVLTVAHNAISFTPKDHLLGLLHTPLFASLLPLVLAHSLSITSVPANALSLIVALRPILGVVSRLTSQLPPDDSAITSEPAHVLVESAHPYEVAARERRQVSFDEDVRWMLVTFDPRCATVQKEDSVRLYIPHPSDAAAEAVLLHTFWGREEWPLRPLLLPGRNLTIELSTASSYVERDNREDLSTHFGYAAHVYGMRFQPSAHPLFDLERELVFLTAQCAGALLGTGATGDGEGSAGGAGGAGKEKEKDKDKKKEKDKDKGRKKRDAKDAKDPEPGKPVINDEALKAVLLSPLLARGITPAMLPGLDDAASLASGNTTDLLARLSQNQSYEANFLREFIDITPGSAGGRLAAWIQGPTFADPSACVVEHTLPTDDQGRLEAAQGVPVSLTLRLRALDGSPIVSPGLAIVAREVALGTAIGSEDDQPALWKMPFTPTPTDDGGRIHCISATCNYSPEELRYMCVSAQQGVVQTSASPDANVSWTPQGSGLLRLEILLDKVPVPGGSLTINVLPRAAPPPPAKGEDVVEMGDGGEDVPEVVMGATPCTLTAIDDADIRSHHSMDAIVTGKVPRGAKIEVTGDYVVNDEGVWGKVSGGCSYVEEQMRHIDAWVWQACSETYGGSVNFALPDGTVAPMMPLGAVGVGMSQEDADLALAMAASLNPTGPAAASIAAAAASAPAPAAAAAPLVEEDPSTIRTGFQFAAFGSKPALPAAAPAAAAPAAAATAATAPSAAAAAGSDADATAKAARRVSFVLPEPEAPKHAKAQLSPSLALCIRSVFAAHLWHCSIVQDAIALSTHLKFHPSLPRPQVSGDSDAVRALKAFENPPPALEGLAEGTAVLVTLPHASMASKAKVVRVRAGTSMAAAKEEGAVAVGMRLEAKDRKNPHMICPATVSEVLPEGRVKVHFDGWSESFDYVASLDDDDLHPVGYAQSVGHKLEVPRGYGDAFKWPKYLKEIGAVPVPIELLQGPSNQEMIECHAAAADNPELYAHPLHPHPLKLVHRASGWGCDGRRQEHGLGCNRGFGDCDELQRYRCTEHCDYDLCPDCMSTLVGFDEDLAAAPLSQEDRVIVVTADGKEHDVTLPSLRLSSDDADAGDEMVDDSAGLVPRLMVELWEKGVQRLQFVFAQGPAAAAAAAAAAAPGAPAPPAGGFHFGAPPSPAAPQSPAFNFGGPGGPGGLFAPMPMPMPAGNFGNAGFGNAGFGAPLFGARQGGLFGGPRPAPMFGGNAPPFGAAMPVPFGAPVALGGFGAGPAVPFGAVACPLCSESTPSLFAHMGTAHKGCGKMCDDFYNSDGSSGSGQTKECGSSSLFSGVYHFCKACRTKASSGAKAAKAAAPSDVSLQSPIEISEKAKFLLLLLSARSADGPAIENMPSMDCSPSSLFHKALEKTPFVAAPEPIAAGPAPLLHSKSVDVRGSVDSVRPTKRDRDRPLLSRAMTIAEQAVPIGSSAPLAPLPALPVLPVGPPLAAIAEGASVSPGDSARKRPALMRAVSLAHPEEAAAVAAPAPIITSAPATLLNTASPALAALQAGGDQFDAILDFVRAPVPLSAIRQSVQRDLAEVARRRIALMMFDNLLRTVVTRAAVHDVLWAFVSALSRNQKAEMSEGIDAFFPRSIHPIAGTSFSGPIADSVRAAFHSMLFSVMILLSSSLLPKRVLQPAVRCWSLMFDARDHAFLNRSHVFSMLSRVLASLNEEASKPVTPLAAVTLVAPFEVSKKCRVAASSRDQNIEVLTNGTTESFWENSDDDRKKWLQMTFDADMCPTEVALHIDNSRDRAQKITKVVLQTGPSATSLSVASENKLPDDFSGWLTLSCPGRPVCVRFDLSGSQKMRVRQLRAFAPARPVPCTVPNAAAQLANETLKVFRDLTSEIFAGSKPAEAEEGPDLRRHAVGVLFRQSGLKSLQSQVCDHLLKEIHDETRRLLQGTTEDNSQSDAYCFELLSMLVTLVGSPTGPAVLARAPELVNDLIAHLHFGCPRSQRTVVQILRKVLRSNVKAIDAAALSVFPAISGLLPLLLLAVAKAVALQVRTKTVSKEVSTMDLDSALKSSGSPWMRGKVQADIAQEVLTLLTELLGDEAWAPVMLPSLRNILDSVSALEEPTLSPTEQMARPHTWLVLAAMSVPEPPGSAPSSASPASTATLFPCENHDDGRTPASVRCEACGQALCDECDRILHLGKARRSHTRTSVRPERATVIEYGEGSCRARLHNVLAVCDRRSLKAVIEFRRAASSATCRFCLGPLGEDGGVSSFVASGVHGVCSTADCVELAKSLCTRTLPCGHACNGVRDEATCLPCLRGCSKDVVKMDADDQCPICFTSSLSDEPCIRLDCAHVFHYRCVQRLLTNRWTGPRIVFGFCRCSVCSQSLLQSTHPLLAAALQPLRELYGEVRKKALMRLSYDGLESQGGKTEDERAAFALDKYAYYPCFKCKKPYFGGLRACQDAMLGDEFNPADLVCPMCVEGPAMQECPRHGTDFLEYKCRFCCSVAVFFCFGTTHFCNPCHDDHQRCVSTAKDALPHCPAGPRLTQLDGTECPLHVRHPPTGEEFALGCGVCRNAQTF